MFEADEEKNKLEKEQSNLRRMYQNTFADYEGAKVLDDILRECSFFCTLNPEDAGQVALHNFSKSLLAKIGIWTDANTEGIVKALYTLPTQEV
jgi:hypothetical protein